MTRATLKSITIDTLLKLMQRKKKKAEAIAG